MRRVVVLALLWVSQAAAQGTVAKTTSQLGSASAAVNTLATEVASALAAFEEGDFAGALQAFERALSRAIVNEQRASLHFNAAACLLELHRPEQAEARFLRVEELSPEQAVTARLRAGLAALAAGSVERATLHAQQAAPHSQAERDLATQLQRGIVEHLRTVADRERATERAELLGKGFGGLDENQLDVASRSFLSIAALNPPDSEQAEALYGLALIAHRRRQYGVALRAIEQSLRLDPTRYEPYWLRGAVHLRMANRQAAKIAWLAALERHPPAPVRAQVLDALRALDPRSPAGISGSMLLFAGYDSNATQSGAAQAVGLAATDSDSDVPIATDSPVVQGQLLVAAVHRLGERGSLREQLLLANWAMTRSAVRDYSLNQAELSLRGGYFLQPWFESWVALAAGHFRSGLTAAEPFVSLLRLSVGANLTSASRFQTRLGGDYEVVKGLQNSAALTGYRLRGFASETFLGGWGSIELGVEGLVNSAQTETLQADPALFPRCASSRLVVRAACDTLRFSVPLSYRGAGTHLDLNYSLWPSLMLEVGVSYQYRNYFQSAELLAGQAGIVVPDSATRRQDHLLDAGLGLFWMPEILGSGAIWLSYSSRRVISNMRPDLDDPEHRFDYEDRNYVQHRVLGGIRLTLE